MLGDVELAYMSYDGDGDGGFEGAGGSGYVHHYNNSSGGDENTPVGLPELMDDDDDNDDDEMPIIGEDGLFNFPERKPKKLLRDTMTRPVEVFLDRQETPQTLHSHVVLLERVLAVRYKNTDDDDDVASMVTNVLSVFPPEAEIANTLRPFKIQRAGNFQLVPRTEEQEEEACTMEQLCFEFTIECEGWSPIAIVIVGHVKNEPETKPTILLLYGHDATHRFFLIHSQWNSQVMLVRFKDAYDATDYLCKTYAFETFTSYALEEHKESNKKHRQQDERPEPPPQYESTNTPELPRIVEAVVLAAVAPPPPPRIVVPPVAPAEQKAEDNPQDAVVVVVAKNTTKTKVPKATGKKRPPKTNDVSEQAPAAAAAAATTTTTTPPHKKSKPIVPSLATMVVQEKGAAATEEQEQKK